MKTLVSLVLLATTIQSMASESRGNKTHPIYCTIEKNGSSWQLQAEGSLLLESDNFENVAEEAVYKEKEHYCHFKRPDCKISLGLFWSVQALGSDLFNSYKYEGLVDKAQEYDKEGFCRFETPRCSITPYNNFLVLRIDDSILYSSRSKYFLEDLRNEFVRTGVCN